MDSLYPPIENTFKANLRYLKKAFKGFDGARVDHVCPHVNSSIYVESLHHAELRHFVPSPFLGVLFCFS